MYIGCTGHIQALGEVSGATFFIICMGCTGQVQAVGEVSGNNIFLHIYMMKKGGPETFPRDSTWPVQPILYEEKSWS
jgi:hypothetical protein